MRESGLELGAGDQRDLFGSRPILVFVVRHCRRIDEHIQPGAEEQDDQACVRRNLADHVDCLQRALDAVHQFRIGGVWQGREGGPVVEGVIDGLAPPKLPCRHAELLQLVEIFGRQLLLQCITRVCRA